MNLLAADDGEVGTHSPERLVRDADGRQIVRQHGEVRPSADAQVALAVLTHDLASISAADEALLAVRADLTMIGGEEVHRS